MGLLLTDVRIASKKIEALGLHMMVDDVIITDELGGEQFRKPCDIAFRVLQRRWMIPFEEMIYIGDNTEKDFQAPQQLGMRCALYHNEVGLYTKDAELHTYLQRFNELRECGEIQK